MTQKTVFVIDTSAAIDDPLVFERERKNAEIVVPAGVIDELEDIKYRRSDAAGRAREALKELDALVDDERLRFSFASEKTCKGDDAVIAAAQRERENLGTDATVYVVTEDVGLRVRCRAQGISARSCKGIGHAGLRTGHVELAVGVELIDEIESNIGGVLSPTIDIEKNEFAWLRAGDRNLLVRKDPVTDKIVALKDLATKFGISPKNREQRYALELLLDPRVSLVTLAGPSGCGKTLLALAVGLCSVLDDRSHKKLIVVRPTEPVGRDIGYLPGTLDEKLIPWVAPIRDNLAVLLERERRAPRSQGKDGQNRSVEKFLEYCSQRGQVEIDSLSHIRGRSIAGCYILADEGQNLTAHELKALVTRVGAGSKLVIVGDCEQVDRAGVGARANGLARAVEAFKGCALAGHVTLTRGERSELATLASKLL